MDIRPIRTDEDHRAALTEIEACWGAAEGTGTGDRLDVLVALVESYEARRWPIEPAEDFDPVDVLHHAIDEFGHSQAELAALLGSRSRASARVICFRSMKATLAPSKLARTALIRYVAT